MARCKHYPGLWTPEEGARLRLLLVTCTPAEAGRRLGRSRDSVNGYMRKHGITTNPQLFTATRAALAWRSRQALDAAWYEGAAC